MLGRFRKVIYWGDFQNNPVWGYSDFAKRDIKYGISSNFDKAKKRWLRLHLLLSERLPRHCDVLSVGNCFLGIDEFFDDREINEAIRSFIKNSKLIAPREDTSFQLLEKHFNDDRHILCPGMDMASLLALSSRPPTAREDYFLYFFSRSRISDGEEAIKEISAQTGLKPLPLRWKPQSKLTLSLYRYKSLLSLIDRAQFVLTDTYHCALNSLGRRTPVICISRNDRLQRGTLGDFKKVAAFRSFGLDEFVVYPEVIEEGNAFICPVIENILSIVNPIINHEKTFEKALEQWGIRRMHFVESLNDAILLD